MSWEKTKEEVLILCKRHCCYCEKYKGRDIEIHHIVPRADGGKDIVDNAIALCFDCHSEIGSYNPKHPKGNSFKPSELKRIRDAMYVKVQNMTRASKKNSESDMDLLSEFKNDYTNILEYCVRIDFASELVDINISDQIEILYNDKWTLKRCQFESVSLEELKINVINSLFDLNYYLSPVYMRYHDESGKLIFRNQTMEEGCRLRDDMQPNTLRIRTEIKKLLDELYLI